MKALRLIYQTIKFCSMRERHVNGCWFWSLKWFEFTIKISLFSRAFLKFCVWNQMHGNNCCSVGVRSEWPKQFSKAACCARPGPSLPAQRAVLPQIVLSAVGKAAAWAANGRSQLKQIILFFLSKLHPNSHLCPLTVSCIMKKEGSFVIVMRFSFALTSWP